LYLRTAKIGLFFISANKFSGILIKD